MGKGQSFQTDFAHRVTTREETYSSTYSYGESIVISKKLSSQSNNREETSKILPWGKGQLFPMSLCKSEDC